MKTDMMTDEEIKKALEFLNYPTPIRDADFRALCRSHLATNKNAAGIRAVYDRFKHFDGIIEDIHHLEAQNPAANEEDKDHRIFTRIIYELWTAVKQFVKDGQGDDTKLRKEGGA